MKFYTIKINDKFFKEYKSGEYIWTDIFPLAKLFLKYKAAEKRAVEIAITNHIHNREQDTFYEPPVVVEMSFCEDAYFDIKDLVEKRIEELKMYEITRRNKYKEWEQEYLEKQLVEAKEKLKEIELKIKNKKIDENS